MPDERESTWRRLTASIARIIVRLWPKETQAWGCAFEAELHEIEIPFASLQWLIGGLMLLTRERFRHFLKSLSRPIGVPAPNPAAVLSAAPVPAPRLPRFVTAIFLSISVVLLGIPEVRSSLASVLYPEAAIRWDIYKLRKEARSNGDPQLLAFFSLFYSGVLEPEERVRFSQEAIEKNPSLAWIDYVSSYWNYADSDRSHFLSDERIKHLQESDPQNAAPILLSAEVISHAVELAYFATTHDSALAEARSWEREIAKNPAWLTAMDRAFAAPKYDNYWTLQLELVRQVSSRYHLSDRGLTIDALLSHRRLDYSDIHAYFLFLMERGDKAAQSGDSVAAAADYEKIESFAERIRAGNLVESDRWFAAEIGSKSAQKLKSILETTNHPAEAQIVAARLADWEKTLDQERAIPHPWFEKHWSKTERAALLINLATLLIVVLFPLVVLAVLGIGFAAPSTRRIFGRFYSAPCLALDLLPILLALSFVLLFLTYHQYARAYQSYLTPGQIAAGPRDIFSAAGVTQNLPHSIGVAIYETLNAYHFWLASIALLSVLALFLLYRMLPRRRSA